MTTVLASLFWATGVVLAGYLTWNCRWCLHRYGRPARVCRYRLNRFYLAGIVAVWPHIMVAFQRRMRLDHTNVTLFGHFAGGLTAGVLLTGLALAGRWLHRTARKRAAR